MIVLLRPDRIVLLAFLRGVKGALYTGGKAPFIFYLLKHYGASAIGKPAVTVSVAAAGYLVVSVTVGVAETTKRFARVGKRIVLPPTSGAKPATTRSA
jgi:hypothetical protein